MGIGVKEHRGKTRWSLIPFKALEPVVRVLNHGATTKYSANNWKYVTPKSYYLDAIVRHWVQYLHEEFDADTGESHLAHLICDALFLLWDRENKSNISFKEYISGLTDYPDYVKDLDINKFEEQK